VQPHGQHARQPRGPRAEKVDLAQRQDAAREGKEREMATYGIRFRNKLVTEQTLLMVRLIFFCYPTQRQLRG